MAVVATVAAASFLGFFGFAVAMEIKTRAIIKVEIICFM
jgi:hypothetical protein